MCEFPFGRFRVAMRQGYLPVQAVATFELLVGTAPLPHMAAAAGMGTRALFEQACSSALQQSAGSAHSGQAAGSPAHCVSVPVAPSSLPFWVCVGWVALSHALEPVK